MKKPLIVVSLGGSLVVPGEIDVNFLKKFRKFIRANSRRFRFVIVVGGGQVNRVYNTAAGKLGVKDNTSLDWIGIYASRLNATLVRTAFGRLAHNEIQTDPHLRINFKTPVLVSAGYRPGSSTDLRAVMLAKNYGAHLIVNLSDIKSVYTADPRKVKAAKPIAQISWGQFQKLVGTKWKARMSAPFDPIASKYARQNKMKVVIAGRDLKNLAKILSGQKFEGTIIS